MGQLADNSVYLKIDSVEVSAYFKSVQLSPSNSTQDTTMGSGVDHMQRAAGLNDTSISMSLGYDATAIQTYIQHIKPGTTITVEYGPEGATSGKPRHVQDFIVTGAQHGLQTDKTPVVFDITGDAADAPSTDMYAGGVYS